MKDQFIKIQNFTCFNVFLFQILLLYRTFAIEPTPWSCFDTIFFCIQSSFEKSKNALLQQSNVKTCSDIDIGYWKISYQFRSIREIVKMKFAYNPKKFLRSRLWSLKKDNRVDIATLAKRKWILFSSKFCACVLKTELIINSSVDVAWVSNHMTL